MRHRILLGAAFLYLAAANIIWIARDTRPPFWDMAGHASGALHIYDAVAGSGWTALLHIPSLHSTGFYPPFYHSVIAASWALFGRTVDVAELTNLLAVALLMLATYGIGRSLFDPFTAALAAVLVSFFPFLLWLSRETIMDYWLTAMVALAIWMLLENRGFSSLGWSIAFGITAGLGMLTKWTFPLFLLAPALWFARSHWKNAGAATAVAAAIAAWWYVPNTAQLVQFLKINTAGAAFEGDPARLSLAAVIFYVRALEGYQLFLPLFVAFLAGLVLLARNPQARWIPVLLWLAGGWLGLMVFQNKDPRYSAPLLPAVALIAALAFAQRRALTGALLVLLLFQHYLVSFGIRRLPESVMLAQGVDGQLSWHWNLYTQSYFNLWGPPAREDWKIEPILQIVKSGRLGLVPDMPRFDAQAFQFYIDLERAPIDLKRLGGFDESAIRANDYLLIAQNDREHAASFVPDARVNGYITDHPAAFRLASWFPLPNGAVVGLYRVQ